MGKTKASKRTREVISDQDETEGSDQDERGSGTDDNGTDDDTYYSEDAEDEAKETKDEAKDESKDEAKDEAKKGSALARMSFKKIKTAAACLSEEAKTLIKEKGFGSMLGLELDGLYNRELISWLMSLSDVSSDDDSSFIINIKPGKVIQVNPKVIQNHLDLACDDKLADKVIGDKGHAFRSLWDEINNANLERVKLVTETHRKKKDGTYVPKIDKKITTDTLEKYVEHIRKNGLGHEKEAQCFFYLLFNTLMQTTDGNINGDNILCGDLQNIDKINWSKVICKHLKERLIKWGTRSSKGVASESIAYGFTAILTMAYLDTFASEEELKVTPRIKYYKKDTILNLVTSASQDGFIPGIKAPARKAISRRVVQNKQPQQKRKKICQDSYQGMVMPNVAYLDVLEASMNKFPEARDEIQSIINDCESKVATKVAEIQSLQLSALDELKVIEGRLQATNHFYDEFIKSKAPLTEVDESEMEAKDKEAIENMKKTYAMNISGHKLNEFQFVEQFKPTGSLGNFIVDVIAFLWNKEWVVTEKVMLSQCAVDELLKRNQRRGYLQREIPTETLLHKDWIFVPLLHDDHWSLVVVELKQNRVTALDSIAMDSAREKIVTDLVRFIFQLKMSCNTMKLFLFQLKMSCNTMIDSCILAVVPRQCNTYDCGLYMLLFILNFGDDEAIKSISVDKVAGYRRTLAMFLKQHEENNPVANESDQDDYDEDEGYTSQKESDAAGSSDARNSEEKTVYQQSQSKPKRRRVQRPLDQGITVSRYTKEAGERSRRLCSLICSDDYKQADIICIGEITITGDSMAQFISGGVPSIDILQAFTECLRKDELDQPNKRIYFAPQKFEEDPVKMKQNIFKTLFQGLMSREYKMIMVPVLHGEDWIIYCAITNSGCWISYNLREPIAEKRERQRKAVCQAVQDAYNDKWPSGVKKPNFSRKDHLARATEELTDDTPHRVALLAMYFLESFSGRELTPCLDGYSTSVLEYLVSHKENKSKLQQEILCAIDK